VPKKSRTGLVRTYATDFIPDTRPADDGYETDIEEEMALALESREDNEGDDLETPKKKKGVKPKVRDLIEDQRDDLAIQKAQEDMDVSVYIIEIVERTISHFFCCLIRFVKLTLPRAFFFLMSHLFDDYLILNELTLFYFNLSATETNEVGKIQNWTARVEKANKNKKINVPGLRTATSTTAIRTTTSSAAVVTASAPTTKNTKLGPAGARPSAVFVLEEDESAERGAAITSPVKGNKRLSSKVRCTNPA
jgi:hypothetical protein